MRILQIVANFNIIGGLESVVKRMTASFVDEGHQVLIFTEGSTTTAEPYQVISIEGLTSSDAKLRDKAKTEALCAAEKFSPSIVLFHTVAAPHLLAAFHKQYLTADFVHMFLCSGGKLFRRQDQICEHKISPRCLLDWYVGPCGSDRSPRAALHQYQSAAKYLAALKCLPGIIVATDYMKNYLVKEGIVKERVYIGKLNYGIVPKHSVVPAADRSHLLFVGRLAYNKGVQYLVEALASLPKNYHLSIVGDGWYRSTLEQLVARFKLEARVSFTGFLQGEALAKAYSEASIAVFPSIWPEPAGLVIPEARSYGLPVVAFDVGGIKEWITRYGYDAIYLSPQVSSHALAETIRLAANARETDKITPASSAMSPPPLSVATILKGLVAESQAKMNAVAQ